LHCAKYSFMPNKLRYCGGDKNSELFGYIINGQSDQGLKEILHDFATLGPYLELIAKSNNIMDSFDDRVVEAYWLGNELLLNVKTSQLYYNLIDKHKAKKKLKTNLWNQVVSTLSANAKPNHSYHVFNIPKRTGHYPVEHTIKTMDECRISWGKIISLSGGKAKVLYRPLEVAKKLKLGKPIVKEATYKMDGKGFGENLNAGDWVSMHWSWVCEKLDLRQVSNLKYWTEYHLALSTLE